MGLGCLSLNTFFKHKRVSVYIHILSRASLYSQLLFLQIPLNEIESIAELPSKLSNSSSGPVAQTDFPQSHPEKL